MSKRKRVYKPQPVLMVVKEYHGGVDMVAEVLLDEESDNRAATFGSESSALRAIEDDFERCENGKGVALYTIVEAKIGRVVRERTTRSLEVAS